MLVVVWLIQGVIKVIASGGDLAAFLDANYQLEINTTTTIITFLMVALLQNSGSRDDQATQHKLNAIADALADLMEKVADRYDDTDLRNDIGDSDRPWASRTRRAPPKPRPSLPAQPDTTR